MQVGDMSSSSLVKLLTTCTPPVPHSLSLPLGALPNPALIMLPPCVFLRVAFFLCPGLFLNLHVSLLWLPLTFYPQVQQYPLSLYPSLSTGADVLLGLGFFSSLSLFFSIVHA